MLWFGAINTVLYLIMMIACGGTPVGGVSGHGSGYVLRLSGRYTETTAAIYYFNLWYGRFYLVSLLLAGYAAARMHIRRRR